jgi:hypothetical protein
MNSFLLELKNFSKQNWWIFILFIVALIIILVTRRWNIAEIVLLFLANFIWNLFIMIMQENYTNKNNKIGAYYHVWANITFTAIAIYGFVLLHQWQYIIWQIAYICWAIKAFSHYNFWKEIKILNETTLILLNVALIIIFLYIFPFQYFSFFQAIGFSLITIGLVSIKDTIRYWLSIIGIFLLVWGSLWGVIWSFLQWTTDGIALGYFLLTGSVLIYYLKLLKKYI